MAEKCPKCGARGKEVIPCQMAPMKDIHYIGASECLTRQLRTLQEENKRLLVMLAGAGVGLDDYWQTLPENQLVVAACKAAAKETE